VILYQTGLADMQVTVLVLPTNVGRTCQTCTAKWQQLTVVLHNMWLRIDLTSHDFH